MKIVAIGDKNFVVGFQLAGIKIVYEVSNLEDAKHSIDEVKKFKDLAIIIIQRDISQKLKDYIAEWKKEKDIYPVILELPGFHEKGVYEDPMREVIKRAIGIDILKR